MSPPPRSNSVGLHGTAEEATTAAVRLWFAPPPVEPQAALPTGTPPASPTASESTQLGAPEAALEPLPPNAPPPLAEAAAATAGVIALAAVPIGARAEPAAEHLPPDSPRLRAVLAGGRRAYAPRPARRTRCATPRSRCAPCAFGVDGARRAFDVLPLEDPRAAAT